MYNLEFLEDVNEYHTKKQAVYFFENGYGISIINIISPNGIHYSYTNNSQPYEVAILFGNIASSQITYDTPITDDVIGYLTLEEVYNVMKQIEQLQNYVN